MKNIITSILVSLLFVTQLSGQLNLNILVDQNASPYVDEFKNNPDGIRIFITNSSTSDQTIRLVGTLKLEDLVVNEAKLNSPGLNDIVVPAGQTVIKRGFEVIDINTFDFGKFKTTVLRTGRLPAGQYTICLTAVDVNSGSSISSQACATYGVTDYHPGELLMPQENAILTEQNNQFTWTRVTPVYTSSALTYTLKIWELRAGENPIAVVKYDNNVVATVPNIPVENTFLNFLQLNLQPEQQYIWTIQAYDANGNKVANQSIPRQFKYGEAYSDHLKALIKLLKLHERLVSTYLELKKITECEAAEELKTKVGVDSLKSQTQEDKLVNAQLLVKFMKKRLDKAKQQYSAEILDITKQMDQLLVAERSLSEYESDVNELKSLQDLVFTPSTTISEGLKTKSFGEKLKNNINEIQPGAYPFALTNDNLNCAVLMGEKEPKLSKEEKKKRKEDDYLLALANSCDATAHVLRQATATVINGGSGKKEFAKVAAAGTDLYTKYEDVKKHVSADRLNETKNQQGIERLRFAFTEIDSIRKDKDRLSDTKVTVRQLSEASVLFKGGDVNSSNQLTDKSTLKVIEPIECFFSNMKISSNGTADGLETTFTWDEKAGGDTVKIIWKEVGESTISSEKIVAPGYSSVAINLKSNVEYEVTLVATTQGIEVARTNSKGEAKLSSSTFLLGCSPKVTHTSNIDDDKEKLCEFFSQATVKVEEVSYSYPDYFHYDDYYYEYYRHDENDPFAPKKYSASVVIENKANTIKYLFYPADDASRKSNGTITSLSNSDSVAIKVADGIIEVNKDYVVVLNGVTEGKTVGEVFVKFYVDQDGKVHYFSGCSLDQVSGKSFEKEAMRKLSDCFFNKMYAFNPNRDCFMFCIGTPVSFRWYEYGDADEIKIENICTVKRFGKIEMSQTYKETLKPGDEYYRFNAYNGKHQITFTAYKDGKEIDRKYVEGRVAAGSFKIPTCGDNSPTAPEPVKLIECPFSSVESTVDRTLGSDYYTAKFKWAKNKNVAGVKAIWHPKNDAGKKLEKTFGGYSSGTVTAADIVLEKDVEYALVLQAFNPDGDLIGWAFAYGKVTASTSTFQIGCDPVPSKVIELNPVEEQCYFTKVNGTNSINTDSSFNHTINWESKDIASVQIKCISEDTEGRRTVVKHLEKDVKSYSHPLNKNESCLCAITAFANKKAVGSYYSGSFKKEETNINYNCVGDPSTVQLEWPGEKKEIFPKKEVPKKDEPVVNKSDCFFGDITSTQTTSGDMIFNTIKWTEQQDSSAKLKIKWNEVKNASVKDEQIISKGKKSATIALKKGVDYTVTIIAEKGDNIIARAIGAGKVNATSSTIDISCKPVAQDEIDNCFFENLYATQTVSGDKINKTFNWTQSGWATKVVIQWHEAKNKNASGEQQVQAGQTSTTITLNKNVDYKVTLLAYMNSDIIGKATATGKVNDKKSTINLACKKVAVPEVEGCFFRYMEVSTVRKNDSIYAHTFKWDPQGVADKYDLVAHNKTTNKLENGVVQKGANTGTIELKKGTKYWVGLMAYKDEKVFARSDNFSVDGGTNNMTLPCNPFSKNTANKTEVKNCFFGEFKDTRSDNDDANGFYKHKLSWEVNGNPRDVLIIRHNLSHNRVDSTYTNNAGFQEYNLHKANKYKFVIKAKDNDLNTIAVAKSYASLGKDEVNFACDEGSANTAEVKYEDLCVMYDIKTSKKLPKPEGKTENHIQLTLKPGYDSYKFYVRNVDVASEVYHLERVIPAAEKNSGQNYLYPNQVILKNDAKYICEVYVYKGGKIVASATSQPTLGSSNFILDCHETPATKINPANTPPASGYEGMDEKCNAFDMKTTNTRRYFNGPVKVANEISFKLKPGIADEYKLIIKSVAGHEISENSNIPNKLTEQEKSYKGAIIIKDETTGLNPTIDYVAYLFVYKDGKLTASAKSEPTKGDGTFVLTCQDGLKVPEIPKQKKASKSSSGKSDTVKKLEEVNEYLKIANAVLGAF